METRTVPFGHGWKWIADGFGLFRKSPLNWILLCLVLVLVFSVFSMLGIIGVLVLNLLYTVFLAGIMVGCRALEEGNRLELGVLLAGFRKNTTPLVTIGGIALVGQIVISGLMLVVGGEELIALFQASGESFQEAVSMMARMTPAVRTRIQVASLVSLGVYLPLMMAVWFAPMLVIFRGQPVLPALKASLVACLKNVLPFLLYGLVLFVLFVLAAIPFGLGLFLLVPTVFASIYRSYRDIFPG
ncbi:MAG: hypothetical protein HYU77_03365 [Betaproteobacteria bacterium]|nr:hypothetical protein [Betaproteobacteria bacterium]